MIVFVGAEDRGYWVRETAQIRGEELEFVESSMTFRSRSMRSCGIPGITLFLISSSM